MRSERAQGPVAQLRPDEVPAPPDFVDDWLQEGGAGVISRFEQMVERHAARPAATHGRQALTYRELNSAANQVAAAVLATKHAGETPTALLVDHDLHAIVGLLGIVKAGRPYVALDAAAHPERLKAMLADAEPDCMVTVGAHRQLAQSLWAGRHGGSIVCIDELDLRAAAPNPGIQPPEDFPFAILYTSGSTGEPKGLVYDYACVRYYLIGQLHRFRLAPSDRLSLLNHVQLAAGFGLVFGAFTSGGAVCLYDIGAEGPRRAPAWIESQGLTFLRVTPSVARAIFEAAPHGTVFPSLRVVRVGGERARLSDLDLLKQHTAPHCKFSHNLGSTDALTIASVVFGHDSRIEAEFLPAGFPPAGQDILLLDDDDKHVAPGEVGEIVVRSRYLPRGYWKQPALTARIYADDTEKPGFRRAYTGDLGRWRPDGMLEFVGRKDFLVKVRGQRVELAELELRLGQHPAVKEALVVARPSRLRPEDVQLCAYIVPRPDAAPSAADLRQHLAASLPAYMIPSDFVLLESLPVSRQGKLDRSALPEPPPREEVPHEALPRSALEESLAGVWSSILKTDRIGVDEDFFALGGDSLSVLSMMLEVETELGIPVPRSFFEQPTIRGLAVRLQEAQTGSVQTDGEFRLEGRGRPGSKSASVYRDPLRRAYGRLRWVSRLLPLAVDESNLMLLLLARRLPGMTVEQARGLIAGWSSSGFLLNTVYLRKQALLRAFMNSLGSQTGDFMGRLRLNVMSNLLLKVLDGGRPLRDDGRSVFSRDRRRLLDETPVDELDVMFPITGLEHLVDAHRLGRGVILASFHGSAMARAGLRLLSRRLGAERIQTVTFRMGENQSAFRNDPRGMPAALQGSVYAEVAHFGQQLLRQGGIVHILGESWVPGLGRRLSFRIGDRLAAVKPGLAELALNTGAAVVPAYGWFDEDGRLLMEAFPPLEPGTGAREAQVETLIEQYGAFVSGALRTHPEMVRWRTMREHLRRPRAALPA